MELDELVRDMDVLLLLRPAGMACFARDATAKRSRVSVALQRRNARHARDVDERLPVMDEEELPSPEAAVELAVT